MIEKKIGFTEWGIDGGSIIEKLKFMHDLGFNSISLKSSFFISPLSYSDEYISLLKAKNFTVVVHSGFGMNSKEVGAVEFIEKELDAVECWMNKTGINIKTITFDPAVNSDGFDFMETVKGLKYACSKFASYELKIGIENWIVSNWQLENLSRIKEAVNSEKLGMLLDLGHLNLVKNDLKEQGMSLKNYIKAIPFDIIELHIHDNDGKKDLHMPPDTGNTDFYEMFSALKEKNFAGIMTLELISCDITKADGQKKLKDSMALITQETNDMF